MKISQLNPAPLQRIQFNGWHQRISAPREPGCYVIASFIDEVLYIGQSVNIANRIQDHLVDDCKRQRTAGGVAHWLYYTICDHEKDLNALERGWILQHLSHEGKYPPFNKVMPPT